jgi:hypothetical protein
MESKMNLYVRNIMALMKMSRSESARFLAYNYTGRVERFLEFINLKVDCVILFAEGNNVEAEKNCHDVFRYGWLGPDGEFVPVGFAQHEQTVMNMTGHFNCDEACEAGWVKFTVGLPYNHEGSCLFESDSNRSKLREAQTTWLNQWLNRIAKGDPPAF